MVFIKSTMPSAEMQAEKCMLLEKNGTYCVMLYNGDNLRLVSWHNAGDAYGTEKWPLK